MAFLRSPAILKNVLVNTHHRGGVCLFTCRKTKPIVFINQLTRYYSTNTKNQTFSLDEKLRVLEQYANKANYVSRENISELLHMFDVTKTSPEQYWKSFRYFGALMCDESPAARASLLQQLWDSLESRHTIEIDHYNAMLRSRAENEQPIVLEEILDNLNQRKLRPNYQTYEEIVRAYSRLGDIEGIQGVLNIMEENQFTFGKGIYNSLILANAIAGNNKTALSFVTKMEESGIIPSIRTYVNVLHVHANDGDIANILLEIEQLKCRGIYIQDKDILDLVYYLAINGHGNSCNQLLHLCKRNGYYKRFAANTIIRLIEKQQNDVAFEVLKTMPSIKTESETKTNSGGFILDKLIRDNRSAEDIIEFCKKLQSEHIHLTPLHTVLRKTIDYSLTNLTVAILRELKAKGIPLRQSTFMELIKATDNKTIKEVLRILNCEFDFKPSLQLLRTDVLPKLNVRHPGEAINLLMTTNIKPAKVATAVALHCLQNLQVKEAADITNLFKLYIPVNLFRSSLIGALKSNNDIEGYVLFLRTFYENFKEVHDEYENDEIDTSVEANSIPAKSDDVNILSLLAQFETPQKGNQEGGQEHIIKNRSEVLGTVIYDTLKSIEFQHRAEILTAILEGLVNQGMTMSSRQADKIKTEMQLAITSDISMHLKELASGELELKPIQKIKPLDLGIVSTSSHLEEKYSLDGIQNNIKLQTELLKAYYREGRSVEFEQLIQKLENGNVSIPRAICIQRVRLRADEKDAAGAVQLFDHYKTLYPDFLLYNEYIVQITSIFVSNNQIDNALQFLANTKRSDKAKENREANQRCLKLLNELAERGEPKDVNLIFNALIENGHINVSKKLLGPLVYVHLINNDLEGAVETFEKLSKQYAATPLKNVLCNRLIRTNNLKALQRVVDISSNVLDENKILLDLALCFVECGRIKQAHNAFTTPDLHINQIKFDSECEKYRKDGSIRVLENLIQATKGLVSINRAAIFTNLLELYIQKDLLDQTLRLWDIVRVEYRNPCYDFLTTLANYLQSRNVQVPFEIPRRQQVTIKSKQVKKNSVTPKRAEQLNLPELTSTEKAFIFKLRHRKNAEIRKLYQQLPESSVAVVISRATRNLGILYAALAEAGDTEAIERVDSMLSDENQDQIVYRNSYAKACSVAGKADQWIEEWKAKLDEATTAEDLEKLKTFPSYGFCDLVIDNPHLFNECVALAEKCVDKNITAPMEAMWCYAFINGDKSKCEELWLQYIRNNDCMDFRSITERAFKLNNAVILCDLIEHLKSSKIHSSALGGIYACLLSIHLNNEKFDDALNIAQSLISLSRPIYRKDLERLKAGLKAAGKEFPFDVTHASEDMP